MISPSEERYTFELAAYHPTRGATEVSDRLRLAPARTIRAGDPGVVPELGPIPENGWFLVGSSGGSDDSNVGSLRWLLSHLKERAASLSFLLSVGWDIYVELDLLPNDTRPAIPRDIDDICTMLGLRIEFPPLHGILGAGSE